MTENAPYSTMTGSQILDQQFRQRVYDEVNDGHQFYVPRISIIGSFLIGKGLPIKKQTISEYLLKLGDGDFVASDLPKSYRLVSQSEIYIDAVFRYIVRRKLNQV